MTPSATNEDASNKTFNYAAKANNGGADARQYGDFDVDAYTKACQGVAGPKANPRVKYLLDSLMAHLHDFCAETDLTLEEWKYTCDLLVRSGKISDDKRNEMILISDVLGIESLLDNLTFERVKKAGGDQSAATETAVLGPFFRENAPRYANGDDIVQDHSLKSHKGELGVTAYISGVVKNVQGDPIAGAEIDVWETAPNGFYEQQDPQQPEYNNRGKFTTDKDGRFSLRCLRPTAYPIPFDSGAGEILSGLDRSPMRPAHIHFWVKADGYASLITQIFDSECEYLGKDAVFADKTALTVEFKKPFTEAGKASKAETEVQYDVILAKAVEEE